MQTDQRPLHRPRRRPRLRPLLVLCVLGACVALAACGSSGGGSSSASTTASTSASKAGSGSNRFAALRSCLQKQGITLPSPPSGGTGRPGGPGAPGGGRGPRPPEGVSQSQFRAALKKCGAGNFHGGRAGDLNSASARAALNGYAACLRTNGVNVPAPNTTGKGPVFNTNGIDTSSSRFKAAQSKCRSDLKGVFPGGGAGGGAGGGPPSGGAGGAPRGGGA